MNLSVGAHALQGSSTEDGSGPIWLDKVTCYSYNVLNYARLVECNRPLLIGVVSSDCSHQNDAGVNCTG